MAKTKVNFKKLKKIPIDGRSIAGRELKTTLIKEIKTQVKKGLSPVKGFNKYKDYDDSTAKKKGRKSPVDLEDTGRMMESLTARIKNKKVVEVFFKGARNKKIARYHHTGTDKMNARPVLPIFKGQVFKKKITDKMSNIFKKAVAKAVKRNK